MNKNLLSILITIGILASIFIITNIFEEKEVKQEVGQVMKDLLYDNETNSPEYKKYVEVFTKIYEPIKIEYGEFKKVGESVNLSDLLEYSSFQSLEEMNRIVEDLNLLIEAWIEYENKVIETKERAENIIRESFDKQEAEVILSSFIEGYNLSKAETNKYTTTGKKYINKILSLYEFLIINYDYYYIDYDETGEQNIFFYYDNDIDRYNKYMEDIYTLAIEFVATETEYYDYINNYFKDYGITVEDFKQYLENQ